ncbi:MAG: substrate-binding domain-containing protein [Rubrivivax sp.]|nr:substrate-binding domain-containing protein [Rubrivivax sp.]
MSTELRLISSMATRQLLAELLAQHRAEGGASVLQESVGGVDAARRVLAGEAFDAVVLASAAIEQLIAAGRVVAGSRCDVARSGIAIAVREGTPRPDIGSELAVRAAVLAASSVGYSTGPSGTHLLHLFERWGIAAAVRERTVQAPPGVPVGSLVAEGRVALGFQQLSELLNQPGISVVGPLPPQIQAETVFSAGLCSSSTRPEATLGLLRFLASDATAAAKSRHGMAAA